MPEKDPCKNWLEEFRKEVDAVLGPHGEPLPAVAKAQADFSAWWESNLHSCDHEKPQPPHPDRRAEIAELVRQRTALEGELARVKQENSRLRRSQAAFPPALLELESTMARAREHYESAIKRLKGSAAHKKTWDE
jgi:predicted RNase H-like nuclease (RuvC/YqgF family)